MQQYTVTGMHCAACSASVEKAVKKVPGVTSCAVSLLTNSMGVEGTAEPAAVIKAVEDAGYGASVRGQEATPAADASALEDRQTPHLKKRLIASVAFLLILMYFSMGHMMWGWPLPSWFDGNHVAMGLVQLLLAGIVMVINQKFFISGYKALWHRAPNMDTLVALGATAAFGYSTYALFAMTAAQVRGDEAAVMSCMMDFYFESAAMILTLITVGKMLEARSKGKTTDALKSLMKLAPQTATLLRQKILAYATKLTRQAVDNMDIVDGNIVRKQDGAVLMSLSELAMTAQYNAADSEHITAESTYTIRNNAYSFGCTFADVEVDIALCKVKLNKIINVHDCGSLINPALAEAQVHGGMSMAIGYGLSEQLLFDEKTGRPLNNNLLDYKLSTIMDHPHLEAQFVENAEPTSAFGTKALGEPPACSGAPAIRNAIYNATGVAIDQDPITPHVLFRRFTEEGLIRD